jgi:replication factor C subunit 2/4
MIAEQPTVELPWYFYLCLDRVEKYRPHVIKDIVGNQDIVTRLQIIARDGNMPNLILSV